MVPHPAEVGRPPALTGASSLICLELSSLRGLRRLAVVSMASLQAPSDARVIETEMLRVRQRLNCIRNDNAPTPRFQKLFYGHCKYLVSVFEQNAQHDMNTTTLRSPHLSKLGNKLVR